MHPEPAILINAFSRPGSLQRLLESIHQAHVPAGVRLVISIDGGGSPAVLDLARSIPWPEDLKDVILQPQPLGLVGHMLACGALTRRYGNVIYLEDDLVVSRSFYSFAAQALEACRGDPHIAAIGLNSLPINGYAHYPFTPVHDGSDAFFARIFWSHGLAFTPQMWANFESWWHEKRRPIQAEDGLHPLFNPGPSWKNEFFPDATHYLHQTRRYIIFPRESHSQNSGDPGTHFDQPSGAFRIPLQNDRSSYHLLRLDEAGAVYDPFFEILPDRLAPAVGSEAFDVDLNGTKPPSSLNHDLALTTRPVLRAIRGFALERTPAEANVLACIPGREISLARREDILRGRWADLQTEARMAHFYNYRPPSLRRQLLHRLAAAFLRQAPESLPTERK